MIDVEIEDAAWTAALADAEALVVRAAEAALGSSPEGDTSGEVARSAGGGAKPQPPSLPPHAPSVSPLRVEPPPPSSSRQGRSWHVTILLTGDAEVRDLNARFREKDHPTNVLSFPAPANPEDHLGDVALAYGTCAREAAEQGKPLAQHLQHLTVHGVLHLLGYDHIGDDEAEAMEGLERAVLAGLGVPDPYAAR